MVVTVVTKIDALAASQGLIPQHLRGVDSTIVIVGAIAIILVIVGITHVAAVAVAAVAAVAVAAVTTNPN